MRIITSSALRNAGIAVGLLTSVLATPTLNAQAPCLGDLPGDETTRAFDATHDRNFQGHSFSCDVFVTASQAFAALEDFRLGFLYDSKAHIERVVKFPLKVNVMSEGKEPQELSIRDFSEWLKFKEHHFDKYERALIACSTLSNVRIYKRDGGFSIGLGRVWFIFARGDGLRVRVVNVAPLRVDLWTSLCLGEEPSDGPAEKR